MDRKIEDLIQLCDRNYALYQLNKDLLANKIDEEEKEEIIILSQKCGRELAERIKEENPELDIEDYVRKLEIKIENKKSDDLKNFISFGSFQEPNTIILYDDTVKMTVEYIQKKNIEFLNKINIREMIITHELFHYLETRNQEMYSNRKKIVLWNLFSYKHLSRINAISEIAASSFIKELLNLEFVPNIIDIILLNSIDESIGERICNEISIQEKKVRNS